MSHSEERPPREKNQARERGQQARRRAVVGRLVKRASKRPGSAPGVPVHTGERKVETTRIEVIDYDLHRLEERSVDDVLACFPLKETPTVSWVNVDGLHDVDLLQRLGAHFDIHPLVLEDLASVGQRPKVEVYDGYLFVVLQMLSLEDDHPQLSHEQFSIVLGPNFLFSFQERPGDVFDPVRERIRSGRGRIRGKGADYLAYALIDAVVDNYFTVLEKIGDHTEALEHSVLEDPSVESMQRVHALKRELLVLRKAVWPLREVLGVLVRSESALIDPQTSPFFRDVQDHAIQAIDAVETLRDVTSGLMDLYLSTIGNRTNEVMKVLTIMASIFIPLSFFAGLYGMNFEFMPELHFRWGYPILLVFMVTLASTMLLLFRRKGWL